MLREPRNLPDFPKQMMGHLSPEGWEGESQAVKVSPAQCFRQREQVLQRLGAELEGDPAHEGEWKLEGQGVRQACIRSCTVL